MAKKIEELVVELGIKGLEGLDNLSSSFRNLQKAIGPSDNAITQVRRSILDMSSAGKQSIQMIQGQIDAFKGLQTQATIGSNVYKQLAGDVNRLSDTLKKLKGDYEEVGRAARQTDAQIANQFPARKPEAFRVQLAALNRELGKLSVSARAYGDALTEITIRETAFGRAQARQGAIAGAQAVGAPLIAAMTPQQALPNTTAALRVQLAELTQDFDNLDRSGEQYAQVAQRISEIQEELSRNILGVATAYDRHAAAENAAIRRAEKMRGIQEYYRGRGAATGFRDPGTGAIIAGGAPGTSQALQQGPAAPARRTSALFQSIADIGQGGVARDIEMMGRSYADVEGVIRRVSAASDGSIASLQKQRNVWQQLFVQLEPGTAIFKRVEQDIQRLDRRLEKFQSRRRGLGAMGATQAAGAVISGGIFGGPEGAIGGIAGTIAGDVPGAFAGAAAGAQLGIMRKALGEMASFTAEIDKQRIALRSVVGSQQDYQQALQFIDATSRRAAIPHDQLTTQFTQLAASVIGAGGSVDIAERAFRGMAAGIRGTGGSLEAMKAAMLATSQVFSKGKVSAEEIRQQIGERLPGAFTTFATAIGKTPAMLDKMLQKGEVTLDDFMLLIEELIRTYEPSMDRIAASSQAAGDRMQVTFARIREAIGRELQPVGAQFQESIVKAVSASEPAIIAFSQGFAAMARVVVDNMDGIAKALEIILAFGAVTGVAVAFANLSAIFNAFSGIVVALTLKFAQLTAVMLANPWALAVAGVAALGIAVGKVVFEQNALNVETEKYINLAKKMPSADIAAEISKVQDELRQARKEMEEAESGGGFSTDLLGLNIKELMKSEGSIDRIEKKLKNLERTYRTKLQIEAIFAGQQGIPEGYKIVNGRLAYQVGNTWVDAETGQPVKKKGAGFGSGGADDENAAKQRASSMLQAIEQRENSIAQARIQLEERAREIRKQAIEQARQLEERFADQRLQREREVAAARRQLAGIEENIGFEMQAINVAAQGGDPEMVRIQQRMAEAARQRDEERITREQQLLDEQTERSKAIESLKKTTADSINEANARYAKAIGEAQREYARAVARIIEEGTGRAGQRLEIAGRLAGLAIQRAQLNAQRIGVGAGAVPEPLSYQGGVANYGFDRSIVPGAFTDIDDQMAGLYKRLAQLPTATAIAGPAIRSISVNTSDLTAQLNQSADALANLGEEFKNISQNIAQRKSFQEFLSQAGQQTQGAFQSMRSMQQDLARSSGVLGLRESGMGREGAERVFDVRKRFEDALVGLKQAYASAFAEAETVGEKLALEEAFVSISANLARAEEQAISFVDAINNIPTDIQLRVAVQDIKDELTALANPANQIIGAATAIGDAFGNSFKGLISGAMSAKQALAGFFQSVADYFLDMASKMIAKWIVMKVIGLVAGMFPGASGQGLSNLNAPVSISNPLGNLGSIGGAYAKGGAFAQNGIVPYAKGGVVNRPTMFKFANGGTMQNGVMGEAGPEAIMPLKRGADGKLGVTANLDGAMSRYRRPPGTMAAAADGVTAADGGTPAAVGGAIDVRYTVERINSVDYVTADQFQQGMQQAAMQGAQRGEQMVLRKLQQSPSTRRRVGVS